MWKKITRNGILYFSSFFVLMALMPCQVWDFDGEIEKNTVYFTYIQLHSGKEYISKSKSKIMKQINF
jgi:hypothetical protein